MSIWLRHGLCTVAAVMVGAAGTISPPLLVLGGDDQHRIVDCTGHDVAISGRRSTYVLRGGCRSLAMKGDLLTIRADLRPGARIIIAGKGCTVSWAVVGRGAGPSSTVQGPGSRIQQAPAGGD